MSQPQRKYARAFREAQRELDDAQTAKIKELVKTALEAIQVAEKRRQDAVNDIQLLKKDLEDLKDGRLDAIKERHEVDKTADSRSPISITIINQIVQGLPVYIPTLPVYTPFVPYGSYPYIQTFAANVSNSPPNGGSFNSFSQSISNATTGTYALSSGVVKMLC